MSNTYTPPPLLVRSDAVILSRQLELEVVHIARGYYPTTARPSQMPVNRFFVVLENPNGSANYICNHPSTTSETLRPGTIYHIPPDHTVRLKLDNTLRFCSIQCSIHFLSTVDLLSGIKSYSTLPIPPALAELIPQLDTIHQLTLTVAIQQILWQLIGMLTPNIHTLFTEKYRRFMPWEQLFNHINSHCNAQLRVEDLAEICHLSPPQLSKKFLQQTGQSPKEFLAKALLKRSMALLCNPAWSIKEIAAQLQFSTEFVFSRFFHRYAGLSPSEYRKLQGINRHDVGGYST